MDEPSSSKVHIEYFDPHGVYPLLSPGLLPRLPLRNLHWESHSGPLRSIPSLHIDLIPSSPQPLLSPLSTTELAFTNAPPLARVKSDDSSTSVDDGFRIQALGQFVVDTPTGPPRTPVKERRHQIPGLRQTPYLKVLFVRCDDNDIYKAQTRREVRDWIKEHTPPSQSTARSNAQENHDAFEWLIVHVIVPNTAAATQPRTSSKTAENGSWRGGGPPSILDKMRADFNLPSKPPKDRMAQIRIGVNDVPYEMLPRVVPAIPGAYTETPQENENSWLDLIIKFKEQILSSFDMRVGQYEEDIRERDAMRTLPGWNFNTFFMLKEGLARGFESVGLVEDALVGYDELAVGLDAIVREQASIGPDIQHGGTFLPYTDDLKAIVHRAKVALLNDIGTEGEISEPDDPIDLQSTGDSADVLDEIPLNAVKKRYRDLILSNNISVFDFRCYLFARQVSLLLRLANAWSSQEELLAKLKEQRESSLQGVAARFPASQPSDDVENLSVLGEVCKRSMDFVAAISRIMRDDIWASQEIPQRNSDGQERYNKLQKDPILIQVVDNVVSSFTFSIAQQVLAQTATKSLPIPPSTLAPPSSKIIMDGQEPKAAIPEPKTMMHPARSSSLAIRSPTMRSRSREPPSPGSFPSGRRASVPDRGSVSSAFLKPGLEELAAHRAELYLLSRNVLEQVGKKRQWSAGWSEVANLQYGDMEDMEVVNLEESTPNGNEEDLIQSKLPLPSLHGIANKLLRVASGNKDDYYRLYETLTDKALRHYTVANHMQSQQSSMADLAVLKFHVMDYAAAASFFYQIKHSYSENGWTQIELSLLVMYAQSLKKLQRKEEFVRVVLKLLSKAAMAEKVRIAARSPLKFGRSYRFAHEELVPTEPYLKELLQITKSLQRDVNVPLQNFFGRVEVDGTPRYHPEQDSIALQLRLRYLLSEDLDVDKVKVRMNQTIGDTTREIWLESDGPTVIQQGNVKLLVQSNVVIPGTYVVNHISLYASNLILKYEHDPSNSAAGKADSFFKCPKLLIYEQLDAFDLQLFASRYHHLKRNRSLEIELSTGRNNVKSCELHVRAATAGLRLQTSEAEVVQGTLKVSQKSEAGIIRFKAINSRSKAKLRIPFNLEHDVNDISVRLEVSYTTEKGDFFFATSPHLSIMLPLGVNVQDVFKHKAVYSRFTISSATTSPLRLIRSRLENSETFQADCGTALTRPVVVFPRQPASMLYKITKLPLPPNSKSSKPRKEKPLSLTLHYICLEEEIDDAITEALRQAFTDTSLYMYIRLVIPSVLAELRGSLLPYDLERIAVLSEVSTSVIAETKWKDRFSGLGCTAEGNEDIPTLLCDALQDWQRKNPMISLLPISVDNSTVASSRSITIPVDVPSVTVVHTVDLRLLDRSSVSTNALVVACNEPIAASLDMKWSRIWDTELPTEGNGSTLPDDLRFVYELSGPPDTWLIGGRRKGNFQISAKPHAGDSDKLSFPVVLIPLREGFLPLPHLDIRPILIPKLLQPNSAEQGTAQIRPAAVSCETNYKNAGETLRVISDALKTTVSLDASGPQGGAWLLESQRRRRGEGDVALD